MLSFLQTIILGVVEGLTEFLPISSTAHLILVSNWMHIPASEFMKSFEIIIQLGAILAVVTLYWRSLLDWETIKRLIVAFIPTGILGFIFYKIIKTYLLGNTAVVLWSLALGGLFLILFELWHQELSEGRHINEISYRHCLYIGLFQSIAMVPGASRSAATIIGGLLLGLPRKTIVEFSFLLAVPTMLAATGLDLIKNAASFSLGQFNLLAVGFITAFILAIIGIKFFLSYIQKNTFTGFGIYRIIAALVFWVK